MGLKTLVKKQIINRFIEQVPIMTKIFKWLTDPTAVGRKRTITSILAIIAVALRAIAPALAQACGAGDFVTAVCSIDTINVAWYLEFATDTLNNLIVPGTDLVTVLMGIWALKSAKGKTAVVVSK